jgi:hypothetical protein
VSTDLLGSPTAVVTRGESGQQTENVVLLWIAFLAVEIEVGRRHYILGNVHDHSSADDLLGDVEMHLALVVEGRYVRTVPCQPFMPRPHSKIVQD